MIQEQNVKPYAISHHLLMAAWEKVRSNRGSADIDRVEIADFESNLKPLPYKIWNRMSSGSYFPFIALAEELELRNRAVTE